MQNLIESRMMSMYSQRLESLSSLLSVVSSQILSDQFLNLKDPSGDLSKYKIDRIGEVVKNIFAGERQGLLLRALNRVAQLELNIPQTQMDPWEKKLLESKIHEVEQLQKQVRVLQLQLQSKQEENKQVDRPKQVDRHKQVDRQVKSDEFQLQSYRNTIQQLHQQNRKIAGQFNKLELKMKEYEYSLGQVRTMHQQSQVRRRQGQYKMKQVESKLRQVSQENDRLKAVIRQNPPENHLMRGEKIAHLKREITVLTASLHHLHQNFMMLRDNTLSSLSDEVSSLKSHLPTLKNQILSCLQQFKLSISLIINSILEKEREKQFVRGRVENRVREMQNQIEYFIENHLIT